MWKAFFSFATIFIIWLLYMISLRPSNNRNWEVGYETLSGVEVNGTNVLIKNLRDWEYDKDGVVSSNFIEKTYNANNIRRVWFVVEPFSKFSGIAHTYFVFDFESEGQKDSVAFSVEARRQKGEKYSAFAGLFKKYELIHVWGTEHDLSGRRVIVENDELYMYPMVLDKESRTGLFLTLAAISADIEEHPRFYNTLFSNCTSQLAEYANQLRKDAIPYHYSYFLPGFAANYLYGLGYISNAEPLYTLKSKAKVTEVIRESYKDKVHFIEIIRRHLGIE